MTPGTLVYNVINGLSGRFIRKTTAHNGVEITFVKTHDGIMFTPSSEWKEQININGGNENV